MGNIKVNLGREIYNLVHRPVYKGAVCYTHPDSWGKSDYGKGKENELVARGNYHSTINIEMDESIFASREFSEAVHNYYNSPTNIRRIFITYRGVAVLYYTSFIEKGARSDKGHWVLRSFPAGIDFKTILSKIVSYEADFNKFRMEAAVNKRAKMPDKYHIYGTLASTLNTPWILGNIEEFYFDWVGLMANDFQLGNGNSVYNFAYQAATGQIKPQIVSTDQLTNSMKIFTGGTAYDRNRYPRLRTVTFISNLGDVLFNPQMPFDKVDSEFNDISKAGMMWYRAPQNVEIFKRTGSVVWYHDFTEGLKVRNKEFRCYPGIYLFDEKYLGDVFESYKQKIDDYNRKLQYGDKAEEETKEEEKAQEESNVDTDLEDLVQRLVKQYGTQTAIYILRIAATGYQSKDIHEIVKSVSEKNQIQMKKYLGVKYC